MVKFKLFLINRVGRITGGLIRFLEFTVSRWLNRTYDRITEGR